MLELNYKIDEQVPLDKLVDLYKSVGWSIYFNLPMEQLANIIYNSHHTIQVFSKDRLIGFARTFSDEVLYVTINDVIVHPEYQNNGIGRRIITHIRELYQEFPRQDFIRLFSEPGSEQFYESLGLKRFKLIPYSLN
nr:MAG: Acetyltransferase (GNAT) domain-containing protein [Candidatus Kentron sp. LPFa]